MASKAVSKVPGTKIMTSDKMMRKFIVLPRSSQTFLEELAFVVVAAVAAKTLLALAAVLAGV